MQSDIQSQAADFFPFSDIGTLVSSLVTAAIIIGALLALIFLLIGGLNWITGSDDKAKIEKAQQRITNSIIGLVLVAAAYAIFVVLKDFLGLGQSIATP